MESSKCDCSGKKGANCTCTNCQCGDSENPNNCCNTKSCCATGDCCTTGAGCGCSGKKGANCTCTNCQCGDSENPNNCCNTKSCCATGNCCTTGACDCGASCSCSGKTGKAGSCQCGPNCKCVSCAGGCGKSLQYPKVATVRKLAPEFEAMSYWNGFKKVRLSSFRGKYVVLFFYPLDFTFVCPTEIIQFSDRAREFRENGCEVLGCSIDSQFTHMEYTKKDRKKGGLGKMDIPLIADVDKSIAKKYGCLIDEGDDAGVAFRATYIIDKNGVVRHISISDLPVGRSVDETLRLVKAFQYTDEFGEVCPASWTPGAATMHADPESQKTQQYWEQEHGKGQQ